MLSKKEAEKIAGAANVHRPDWSIAQLMGVLGDERIRVRRTYRDTAVAMAWVATDIDSRQPTRLLADEGPWWEAARPLRGVSASAFIQPLTPTDCDVCGRPPDWRHIDHDYQPRNINGHGTRAPMDQLVDLIATTRLEMTAAPEEEPAKETR